jgi:hypothetical protein
MNAVIEWLDTVCQEASAAAKTGDTGLANRLARNPALNYYFVNVHNLGSVSRPTFESMVNFMTEAERVYNEVKADELREAKEAARDAEIAELKTGLAEALGLLKNLTESKEAPAKGKGKKAAEVETEADEAE